MIRMRNINRMVIDIPLISVVIPIYNVEKYLDSCIESVIRQTYQNLEILLVNDGSTDQSEKICREYANKDARIKIINRKNGGLSAARNSGIREAKGKYIFLLDSDDVIHTKTLQILYESLYYTNSKIAIISHKCINEDQTPNIYENDLKKKMITLSGRECNCAFISNELDSIDMTVAWGKLYSKCVFDKIKYPEGKLHEDEYTTYKIFDMCDKCVYIKTEVYYYRIRQKSIMSSKKTKNYIDAIMAFKEREKYFEERKKNEEQAIALYRILMEYITFYEYLIDKQENAKMREEIKREFKKYYNKQKWKRIVDNRTKEKFLVFYFSPMLHHLFAKEDNKNGKNKN